MLNMSAIDTTIYESARTPVQALRSMFASQQVSQTVRKAIADKGLLTVESFAQLGSNGDGAVERLLTFRAVKDALPEEGDEILLERLKLAAVWSLSTKAVEVQAELEIKYAEDPTKVPVIPVNERNLMRTSWKANHKEFASLLSDDTEAHTRFQDKVKRDTIINGRVGFYEVAEMRLKSDVIVHTPHLPKKDESIYKEVCLEQPAKVDGADSLCNRIFAFFVLLEMLGVVSTDEFNEVLAPHWVSLSKAYKEHGKLGAVLKADKLIRKKVDEILVDNPSLRYAEAFKVVQEKHNNLWEKAELRTEIDESERARAGVGGKRAQPASEDEDKSGSHRAERRQRQKAAKAAKKAELKQPEPAARGSTGAAPPPPPPHLSKRRIPADEFAALSALPIKGNCTHWNSSMGCTLTGCRFEHKCRLCGGAHTWYSKHR